MSTNFFGFGNFGFGGSSSGSSLYSLIGEYNNIRSGAYYKSLKQYYSMNGTSGTSESQKTSSKKFDYNNLKMEEWNKKEQSEETQKPYSEVKSKVNNLKTAASKLTTTGTDSLFVEKEMTVKDENTGEETTKIGIDEKAIRSAVKNFVSSYNDTLKAANATGNSNVTRNANYMTNLTNRYSRALEEVGISINSDNTLSVDEDKLNNAKTDNLKKLFNGTASYASFASQRASMVSDAATRAASSSGLYNKSGSYSYQNSNSANSLNWYL